ncbi:malonyl-ACP O-methyltransferase BioC [Vibrio ziniensis]|uniref:Malonyl-[acyl-carrier protein] O-methyltransferase n=1 Tax=Vibrio ziniensis TaxID=2711221 RepID=A0A6G7CJB9_9VIBR|nr:malonyl-ACP O-methyltransferase BioC [Vibrio ziniensis]QIH42143.1 malonyl-ACP O-methyltransferase BioC [Vibrio ziniensis]
MSELAFKPEFEIKDKSAISQAFSKAAASYDKHAAFQRDVGHRLLQKLPADLTGLRVLDLGCGTGYFSHQLKCLGATVVCADLSPAMLEQAQLRCGDDAMTYVLADAESLPFSDGDFDIVFSSLALQWCDDLSVPLSEIRRVLKPLGRAYFSTLLDGSLIELKRSWAKIDFHQHVNDFISFNQVKIALAQAEISKHHLNSPSMIVWYDTAFELMRDLKGIGANHIHSRTQGLTGRRALTRVEQAYEQFRSQQGSLPATYQVCLGVIYR